MQLGWSNTSRTSTSRLVVSPCFLIQNSKLKLAKFELLESINIYRYSLDSDKLSFRALRLKYSTEHLLT
jgi:hypothetical protein